MNLSQVRQVAARAFPFGNAAARASHHNPDVKACGAMVRSRDHRPANMFASDRVRWTFLLFFRKHAGQIQSHGANDIKRVSKKKKEMGRKSSRLPLIRTFADFYPRRVANTYSAAVILTPHSVFRCNTVVTRRHKADTIPSIFRTAMAATPTGILHYRFFSIMLSRL